MPYTAPTPAELKARYPAFSAVLDATVQVWLTDSERFVDESWLEVDYQPAIMSHAAHQMALLGIGSTTGAGALPAGVTRFKSGTMDVTISDKAASEAAAGDYGSTPYGREYQRLLRRNFSGPRVIVAGTLPPCGYR